MNRRVGFHEVACRLGLLAVLCAGCARAGDVAVESPAARGESLLERAAMLERSGDYVRSEQYLNAALAAGSDERRLVRVVVRVCVADQRFRDAEQYLEQYLRRHPADEDARFVLATLHLSLGRVELARKGLDLVLRANPKRADAHFALAVLLRDEGLSYAEADAHFRAYLALAPDGPHAEEARGSRTMPVP